MPMVQAKCTNCGANLEVENTKDAAVCPYCGTAYVVEKADNAVRSGILSDFVIRGGVLERYNGVSMQAIIPDSVFAIGDQAFKSCRALTKVQIAHTVKEIGSQSFCDCSQLVYIKIPNSVTKIGYQAFYGCSSLTKIALPENITRIAASTFQSCSSLMNISIPRNVSQIEFQAFCGCSSLKSISIPKDVTMISQELFRGCSNLVNIDIPNTVTTIGSDAFRDCRSLVRITIPSSVTTIGNYAFGGCENLKEVEILGSPEIREDTFLYCSVLSNIIAPEEWKCKHWRYAKCLERYRPTPPPPSTKSSGCYIATSVYGSYDCPQVWTLRRYRDYTLAETWYGRAFIRCYYAVSPTLVRWFGETKWFRRMWKKWLDKMVSALREQGISDSPYNDRPW